MKTSVCLWILLINRKWEIYNACCGFHRIGHFFSIELLFRVTSFNILTQGYSQLIVFNSLVTGPQIQRLICWPVHASGKTLQEPIVSDSTSYRPAPGLWGSRSGKRPGGGVYERTSWQGGRLKVKKGGTKSHLDYHFLVWISLEEFCLLLEHQLWHPSLR